MGRDSRYPEIALQMTSGKGVSMNVQLDTGQWSLTLNVLKLISPDPMNCQHSHHYP